MATLEGMARKKFPFLSEAEGRVLQAAPGGTTADCRDLGGDEDLQNVDGTPRPLGEQWPETRNVRADLIRWLVVDREARELVDPKGVWIQGARITGDLDLSFTNVLFPLALLSCRVERDVDLEYAKMPLLSLKGSWPRAIDADGLKLEGDIFLNGGFHAEGEVRLLGATIGGDLSAEGGTFKNLSGKALSADGAKIGGNVFMKQELNAEGKVQNEFMAEGEVRLLGAIVGGNLEADGGTFKRSNGKALSADGVRVAGSVFLRSGFNAEGEVRLLGATIGGNLDATGGTFKKPCGNVLNSDGTKNETALNAERIKVGGNVLLRRKFAAEGEMRLVGAAIGGSLDARGGTFKEPEGYALNADRAKIDGSVFMTRELNAKDEIQSKFVAEGEVRLHGATIGGDLNANGGTFKNLNPKGSALSANRIKVSGGVFLRRGFSADGQVRLLGATIGGNLDATDGTFKKPSGNALNPDGTKNETALNADGIKVTGDIFLRKAFSAEGEVRLLGATIGGDLDATGGRFKRPDENAPNADGTKVTGEAIALNADSIKVHGSVLLRDKFVAEGEVWLCRAEVNGQLEVDDAWLDELNLDSAHITGPFLWQNIHKDAHPDFRDKKWKRSLNLTDAKVGPLADQESSWPEKGGLHLDGFVYDRIDAVPDPKPLIDAKAPAGAGAPIDEKAPIIAKERLRWLGLQPENEGYLPQPYEQLIAVLRRIGHEHQVAKVAIAKQKDLRKRGHLGFLGWIRSWFLYLAVGYGYKPWRAFGWLVLLVLIGTCVFSRAHSANVLVPSEQAAYTDYENSKMEELTPAYPRFHAPLYSLDVISPFDLGQKSHWRLIEGIGYWRYEFYSLIQLFIGWMLLLVAAAVPAGFIKKD